MAMSTCVKCGNGTFEIKEAEPHDSKYTVFFVQCRSCGGVAGAMDYFNIGSVLERQNKAIKEIARKLGVNVSL